MNKKNYAQNLHFFLALGTDTEKIKAMGHNFKACILGQFLGHIPKAFKVRINNFSTFCADQMRVRIRLVSVITVAPVAQADFNHFF